MIIPTQLRRDLINWFPHIYSKPQELPIKAARNQKSEEKHSFVYSFHTDDNNLAHLKVQPQLIGSKLVMFQMTIPFSHWLFGEVFEAARTVVVLVKLRLVIPATNATMSGHLIHFER